MTGTVFDARVATGERPPLEGKVALITGAANGIGRAAVELFTRAGARVVGCDLRGGEAGGVEQADATSTADMERVAALAVERYGRLDAVFTCAGVGTIRDEPAGVHLTEDWVWEQTLAVNLTGTFVTCRAALPHMLAGGGSIVTVASIYGLITGPGSPAYAASKAGVLGLTRALAVDYAAQGIRANALCPGFCGTDMVFGYLDKLDDPAAARREVEALHLLDRLGLPEEIAAAALWLASDAASFMTGAAIPVDGGYTTR